MAKIEFVSSYQTLVQSTPEKKFIKDGKEVLIAARPAGKATMVVAKYEESTLEFIFPESFSCKDFGLDLLTAGDIITVRCPALEGVKPLICYNVDMITSTKGKK